MLDTEADITLALHDKSLRQHDEAIKRINERIDAMHDWQLTLNAQLSLWRWLAPILASVASSVVTALIIRSIP